MDETPVAFSMVVRSGQSVTGLATDYDLSFKQCSPGIYLFSQFLQDLAELGVTHATWPADSYDYKLFWTKQYLCHSRFLLFHQGIKSRLLRHGKILGSRSRGATLSRSRLPDRTEILAAGRSGPIGCGVRSAHSLQSQAGTAASSASPRDGD